MAKRRLFKYLAAASGYIGLGMILGYVLSDQATNTPLWIGVVLAFLGSVLMGMFISSTEAKEERDHDIEHHNGAADQFESPSSTATRPAGRSSRNVEM